MSYFHRLQEEFRGVGLSNALTVVAAVTVLLTCVSCASMPITTVRPTMTQDIAVQRIRDLLAKDQVSTVSESGVHLEKKQLREAWSINPRIVNDQGWEEYKYFEGSEQHLPHQVVAASFSRVFLRYADIQDVKRQADTIHITMRDDTRLTYAYSYGPSNPVRAFREMQEIAEAFLYMRQHSTASL